jgi:cell wall-associated NlpC family hydrolase
MWSRKYVGIPYVPHGRDFQGVDCYGLLRLVFRQEFGAEIPEYVYDDATVPDAFEAGLNDSCWSLVAAEQLGDVILLTVKGKPFHCGLVLEPGRMLHVTRLGYSACIERYDSPRWANRVRGFYRHKGFLAG